MLKAVPPGLYPGVLELRVESGSEGDRTKLSLIHSGFSEGPDQSDEYEGALSGWLLTLSVFKYYVENHFGTAGTKFFAMRPAQFAYRDLLPYYRHEDLLRQWLTRSGEIERADGEHRLVLQDGNTITGRVLAVSRHEVSLCWNEIQGAVEFKAFALPLGDRCLSIRGCGWNLTPEGAAELETYFTTALDRLAAALQQGS
jgi:hypothetical protein